MLAVRYVVLTALVVWLGGMIVIGAIVAPSAFRVLPTADVHTGGVLAGLLVGDVLRQFHLVAYLCGAIVVVGLFVMKFVGPPPAAFVVRVGLVVAMLGSAVYSGVPLSRDIAQVQATVAGPVSALVETDPRRIRFDVLHQRSAVLMAVNVGLGLLSLFWYTRE